MEMSTIESFGFFKILLAMLLAGYLGLMLFAALLARRLVFPAPTPGYKDAPDIIKFPYDEDGRQVSMVLLKHPQSAHLVFYHHGNGEDLSHVMPRLEAIRDAGFSVLGWDYPGYGTSDGKPSESLIYRIAGKILQSIPDTYGFEVNKVIHYGRSLGGGPAVWLATHHPCAGIILEGCFTSIFRVAMPVNILPWDLFNNLKRMRLLQCPSLVIHGTHDRTVPFSHGQRLYEAAPDPKFHTWLERGAHNGLLRDHGETFHASLIQFKTYLENK